MNTLAAKQAGNDAMADVVSGAGRDWRELKSQFSTSIHEPQQIAAKQQAGAGGATEYGRIDHTRRNMLERHTL